MKHGKIQGIAESAEGVLIVKMSAWHHERLTNAECKR